MLKNGTFTEGWTDMPPAPGNLINQQPKGWTLRWIEPGEPLFDSPDKATGVPECVHKLANQLPPNERRGGPNALILAGDTTYKIFHFAGAFGAELSQTVTGLKPGSQAKLTVPILAVRYNETDPYGTETGVWVNGEGGWANGNVMKNRQWYRHEVTFTVPGNGTAVIQIRVKNKWPVKKDYFIDNITLEAEEAEVEHDQPPSRPDAPKPTPVTPPDSRKKIQVSAPEGIQVIKAVSDKPNVLIIVAPEGVDVEVK